MIVIRLVLVYIRLTLLVSSLRILDHLQFLSSKNPRSFSNPSNTAETLNLLPSPSLVPEPGSSKIHHRSSRSYLFSSISFVNLLSCDFLFEKKRNEKGKKRSEIREKKKDFLRKEKKTNLLACRHPTPCLTKSPRVLCNLQKNPSKRNFCFPRPANMLRDLLPFSQVAFKVTSLLSLLNS